MPDHARLRYKWVIALQRMNAPEKAEQAYREAIELAPENVDFLYCICTLNIQKGQYEEALPHVRKLVEQDPTNKSFSDGVERITNESNTRR